MTSISPRHWQTIIDLIHSVNAHLEKLDEFRLQVLSALQKTIRFENATFFLFDDHLNPTKPVALNIQEKYLQLYQTHFFRFNQFDPTHGKVDTQPAVADSALYRYSDFKKSYFYNEFFKPQNQRRQMVLFLKNDRKLLGFIGLHRCNERQAFSDCEVAIARTVSPLLSQSLSKAQIYQKSQSHTNFLQAVLDRTSEGVLLLSQDLEPLFINRIAQELFARIKRRNLSPHSHDTAGISVPSAVIQLCRELQHQTAVAGAPLTVSAKKTGVLTLSNTLDYSYCVEILDKRTVQAESPLIVVTIYKPSLSGQHLNETRLQNDLGFTRREIELAHYLFKGLKNSEIAQLLFITEGTVKNHFRNMFEKTGVNTRTGLIHEIMAF